MKLKEFINHKIWSLGYGLEDLKTKWRQRFVRLKESWSYGVD